MAGEPLLARPSLRRPRDLWRFEERRSLPSPGCVFRMLWADLSTLNNIDTMSSTRPEIMTSTSETWANKQYR